MVLTFAVHRSPFAGKSLSELPTPAPLIRFQALWPEMLNLMCVSCDMEMTYMEKTPVYLRKEEERCYSLRIVAQGRMSPAHRGDSSNSPSERLGSPLTRFIEDGFPATQSICGGEI